MLKRLFIALAIVALAALPAGAGTAYVVLTTPGTPTSAMTGAISGTTLTTSAITFNNSLTTPPVGMFVYSSGILEGYVTAACTGSAPVFTCTLSQNDGTVASGALTTLYGWQATVSLITLAETIGGGVGGQGFAGAGDSTGGGAGGYSSSSNLSVTVNAYYPYEVGLGGAGTTGGTNAAAGASWFNGATLAASSVGANGAPGGASNITGASTTGAVGTTKFAGGNGNTGPSSLGTGGGAGGPAGAGKAGGSGTISSGGAGGNGSGGAGGTQGNVGGNGTDMAGGLAGSGGGAGSAPNATSPGQAGGLYGGAGSGGGTSGSQLGGNGAQGVIVLSFTTTASPSLTLTGSGP